MGFNRRFAPPAIKLKEQLNLSKSPKSFLYTFNAGQIEQSNWIHDPKGGGGRLIVKACHFVDLLRNLVGSPINNLELNYMKDSKPCLGVFTISIKFEEASKG